jgi:hypothetical protein
MVILTIILLPQFNSLTKKIIFSLGEKNDKQIFIYKKLFVQ